MVRFKRNISLLLEASLGRNYKLNNISTSLTALESKRTFNAAAFPSTNPSTGAQSDRSLKGQRDGLYEQGVDAGERIEKGVFHLSNPLQHLPPGIHSPCEGEEEREKKVESPGNGSPADLSKGMPYERKGEQRSQV